LFYLRGAVVIEHPVISALALKKWAKEHLQVEAPDGAIFRLQEQLTFMAHAYLSSSAVPGLKEMFERPSAQTADYAMAMSEKARRVYTNVTAVDDERFKFGNVKDYDRELAETRIVFLWTVSAVNLKRAKLSKILGPICAKTVQELHSSVFTENPAHVLVSIADLKSTLNRDKRHQRMMWIGFDGKSFYRVQGAVVPQPGMPMDGASELVSFFQADKEVLCVISAGKLVLVGPQRVAVVETITKKGDPCLR
jgi:hypothetical protein